MMYCVYFFVIMLTIVDRVVDSGPFANKILVLLLDTSRFLAGNSFDETTSIQGTLMRT